MQLLEKERNGRELALCQYQGTDNKWYHFIDERHYQNTVESEQWGIRFLSVDSVAGFIIQNAKG